MLLWLGCLHVGLLVQQLRCASILGVGDGLCVGERYCQTACYVCLQLLLGQDMWREEPEAAVVQLELSRRSTPALGEP